MSDTENPQVDEPAPPIEFDDDDNLIQGDETYGSSS